LDVRRSAQTGLLNAKYSSATGDMGGKWGKTGKEAGHEGGSGEEEGGPEACKRHPTDLGSGGIFNTKKKKEKSLISYKSEGEVSCSVGLKEDNLEKAFSK